MVKGRRLWVRPEKGSAGGGRPTSLRFENRGEAVAPNGTRSMCWGRRPRTRLCAHSLERLDVLCRRLQETPGEGATRRAPNWTAHWPDSRGDAREENGRGFGASVVRSFPGGGGHTRRRSPSDLAGHRRRCDEGHRRRLQRVPPA